MQIGTRKEALARELELTPSSVLSLAPCLRRYPPNNQVRGIKQSASSSKNAGMSQEELLAQQELLFAASRARFAGGEGAPPPAQ